MVSGTTRGSGLHIGGLELTLAWGREENLELPAREGTGGAKRWADGRTGPTYRLQLVTRPNTAWRCGLATLGFVKIA